jgi:hypothetical protein
MYIRFNHWLPQNISTPSASSFPFHLPRSFHHLVRFPWTLHIIPLLLNQHRHHGHGSDTLATLHWASYRSCESYILRSAPIYLRVQRRYGRWRYSAPTFPWSVPRGEAYLAVASSRSSPARERRQAQHWKASRQSHPASGTGRKTIRVLIPIARCSTCLPPFG